MVENVVKKKNAIHKTLNKPQFLGNKMRIEMLGFVFITVLQTHISKSWRKPKTDA